jgi:hypothetical protein
MSKRDGKIHTRRPRRGAQAIQQLIQEYEASGQSRAEFCGGHDLALSTLDRYLRKHRTASGASSSVVSCELVPVEMAMPSRVSKGARALAVVLPGGRRVEVEVGFDAATLTRLVAVLERI